MQIWQVTDIFSLSNQKAQHGKHGKKSMGSPNEKVLTPFSKSLNFFLLQEAPRLAIDNAKFFGQDDHIGHVYCKINMANNDLIPKPNALTTLESRQRSRSGAHTHTY